MGRRVAGTAMRARQGHEFAPGPVTQNLHGDRQLVLFQAPDRALVRHARMP